MTRDDLYEIAFQYKKAGIWRKLWDNEVFAIKLKSGEIGFVSIMGKNGEYNALGLYIGEEGFGSYRAIAEMDEMPGAEGSDWELLLQQKCLQLALEVKEDLEPDEVDEVKAYAGGHGIKLSGKNAYPKFRKFEPNYIPWKVETEEDMDSLCEAALGACLLAKELETGSAEELGIVPIGPFTEKVPLFEIKGDKLVKVGSTPMPESSKPHADYVEVESELALATVKKLPKADIWEAALVRMPAPIQDPPETAPYYPLVPFVVDTKTHYLLPTQPIKSSGENAQMVFQTLAGALKEIGCFPKEVRCRDERTYAFFKDFCEKTGAKIRIYEKDMPALDYAVDRFLSYMDDRRMDIGPDEADEEFEGSPFGPDADDLREFVDNILSMSKKELRELPEQLLEEIKAVLASDVFPQDVADALRKKLQGI